MKSNEGKLNYKAMGKTIFACLDSIRDSNADTSKNICKIVWASIEKEDENIGK